MKYNKNLIKFHLKDKKKLNVKTQIYLVFVFNKKRLRYFSGKRIEPKYWDFINQRVKSSYPNYQSFNRVLKTLSNYLEENYNNLVVSGKKITIEELKEILNKRLDKAQNTDSLFKYFDEFIELSKNERKYSTIKTYNSAKSALENFQKYKHYYLNFESIDHKFDERFKDYLINDVRLTNNTISNYYKRLKTFLNWAVIKGYNTNLDFKSFRAKPNDGEIYFLTWDELMNLYELELADKKLMKVRDIFCFGCFTGLRFSDIINLKQDNINNDTIQISTIKTDSQAIIPLNKYSREIYEKYHSDETVSLFPGISNQKMNDYLKELGEKAKINTPVRIVKYRGAERIEETVPKFKIISSHIARKTFITNALAKGMSSEVIMDITTHKSYRAFQRYFKIVDEHKKEQMNKVFG